MSKRLFLILLVLSCGIGYWVLSGKDTLYMLPKIINHDDVRGLFPTTAAEVESRCDDALATAKKGIEKIIGLSSDERTYDNTILAIDRVTGKMTAFFTPTYSLAYVSTQESVRNAANQATVKSQGFIVDMISNNPELYKAVKEYADQKASSEQLNDEEKKYLKELLDDFKKSGLALPEAEQKIVKALKKELAQLSQDFSKNINSDNSLITVNREALAGCDDSFIDALKKDESGQYILGVDYPTYFGVMKNCSVESTRRDLFRVFNKRAYPVNEQILKDIIAKRDKLAKMLGFASYAHLNIDDEMAQTPERVQSFLEDLRVKSQQKYTQEVEQLKANLPAGVTLTSEGQFKPWDFGYISAQFKKNNLALDEEKIKEYFPMQNTLNEVLDIYSQFLGVEFRQEKLDNLWHDEVRYIGVYRNDRLMGHLLMDLFPRDNKYGHACMIDLVSAVKDKNGEYYPPVIMVIANFPKPTADRPALLMRNDVVTFFHEFGHAMHGLFGATQHVGFSGTNVKHDFVEVPSQMLEDWMYDAEMLKKVSSHYKTGESLSDEVIEKINVVKRFDSGYTVQRQVALSQLALAYFAEGESKDPYAIKKDIFSRFNSDMLFDQENHVEVSFGHLTGYAAKYYSYLWSKVYAVDMFAHVKKFGLLNREIGQKYIDEVIGKGGSVDPDILLKKFLGREPSSDAFFTDLGL